MGHATIMPLESLHIEFGKRVQPDGNCSTHKQTERAPVKRWKSKVVSVGLNL